MPASLEELVHQLANKISVIDAAAWMVLTSAEDETELVRLLAETERAAEIVWTMRERLKGLRHARNPKSEDVA